MTLIPVPPPIDARKAMVARARRDRYMNRG